MFKVNDYIMYGMVGVCKVTDITEEKFTGNILKNYYVLNPVYSKNTIIKIPVDNERIVMRKIHSKEEIFDLIGAMHDKEISWIEDSKERNNTFKLMLKTGDCEDLITIIKSIEFSKKERELVDKKISKSDDDIMKVAEKLLNEEFATILEIDIDDVKEYIVNHVAH